tara:strand:- start:14374 stop:15114 length:741 start_codon:yes stop_codon:yes gene_type:complete
LDINFINIILAHLALFLASIIYTISGFGLGLISIPILINFFDTKSVVILINITTIYLALLIIRTTHEIVDSKEIIPILIFGILGVPFGIFLITSIDVEPLKVSVLLAIIIISVIGFFQIGNEQFASKYFRYPTSFVTTILITTLGLGTPLLVIVLNKTGLKKNVLRKFLAIFGLSIQFIALFGYIITGLITVGLFILLLSILPTIYIGFKVGNKINLKLNNIIFERFIYSFILISSIFMLVDILLI